jgi:hypothetical protein
MVIQYLVSNVMHIRQSRREITIGAKHFRRYDRRLQSKEYILTPKTLELAALVSSGLSSVCHSVCSSEMLGVITSQSTALVSPSPSL